MGELIEPWKAGREIQPEELGAALRPLSRAQAEAVKRRVRSLNHTVKQRFNQRQRVRKPDIRDVFKDAEVLVVLFIRIIRHHLFTFFKYFVTYSFLMGSIFLPKFFMNLYQGVY